MKKSKKFYLNIAAKRSVFSEKIVGIFDLDKATVKKDTREYLNTAEKKGQVETEGYDIPLSFLVLAKKKKSPHKKISCHQRVILSPVSVQTLYSRSKQN